MSGTVRLAELHGDEYVEARIRSGVREAEAFTSDPKVLQAIERALRSQLKAERDISRNGFATLGRRKKLKSRYAS